MKKNLPIAILPLFLFLFSCSNDLSRDKAKDLIVQKYNLPQTETVKLGKSYLKKYQNLNGIYNETGYSGAKEKLDALLSQGLITIGESQSGTIGYGLMFYATVMLTDEGKKYLIKEDEKDYEMKSNEIAFGEITGIQVNEKSAEVDYTLQRVNFTPFGNSSSKDIMTERQFFALYDDGWRISE